MLDVTPTKAVLWEYGFDWLDRLVTVKRAEAVEVASLPASPLGPTALQRSYVFDESDNRTFFDDHVNDVTYYYKYKSIDDNGTTRYSDQLEEILIYENAAGHRIVGDFDSFESLEHDLDGNLTQRTITSTGEEISYQWTALDRLKRVESSANGRMQDARYNVDGLRERKLASGALTQFKNGNSSVEYGVGISTAASGPGATNSAAPSISYISGHMIMGAEIDGTFVFHLGDALSSVRDVVDHTGTVIKSFEFDEYGNLLSSTGSGATSPKTWIGGLSVNDDRADSGMFNMGHRNYAAGVLGRFISRDPIGHHGNLNLYAYPTNPVNFVDPAGLTPWWQQVKLDFDLLDPEDFKNTEGTPPPTKCMDPKLFDNSTKVFHDGVQKGLQQDSSRGGPISGSQFLDHKGRGRNTFHKFKLAFRNLGGESPGQSQFRGFGGLGGPTILILGLMGSLGRVASADPCDQSSVAAGEGASLAIGSSLAALLSRIPFGGPIGGLLMVGGLSSMLRPLGDGGGHPPSHVIYESHPIGGY